MYANKLIKIQETSLRNSLHLEFRALTEHTEPEDFNETFVPSWQGFPCCVRVLFSPRVVTLPVLSVQQLEVWENLLLASLLYTDWDAAPAV